MALTNLVPNQTFGRMNKERWGVITVQSSDCNWKMPFGGMGTTQGKLKVGREAEALCLSFGFFLTPDFFMPMASSVYDWE